MAQTVKRLPTLRETRVQSLAREDPLEKKMATHSGSHAWKLPWTEEPRGLQSIGSQSRTRLSDFTSLLHLGGASGKESACQCRRHRELASIPGLGRFPGGGHGNPPQYACLENPMDRGAWRATIYQVTKSQDMTLAAALRPPRELRPSCPVYCFTSLVHPMELNPLIRQVYSLCNHFPEALLSGQTR